MTKIRDLFSQATDGLKIAAEKNPNVDTIISLLYARGVRRYCKPDNFIGIFFVFDLGIRKTIQEIGVKVMREMA